MATCKECQQFFALPEDADDYQQGKGDCVTQKEDEKGKYWLSKPVTETSIRCELYRQRQRH